MHQFTWIWFVKTDALSTYRSTCKIYLRNASVLFEKQFKSAQDKEIFFQAGFHLPKSYLMRAAIGVFICKTVKNSLHFRIAHILVFTVKQWAGLIPYKYDACLFSCKFLFYGHSKYWRLFWNKAGWLNPFSCHVCLIEKETLHLMTPFLKQSRLEHFPRWTHVLLAVLYKTKLIQSWRIIDALTCSNFSKVPCYGCSDVHWCIFDITARAGSLPFTRSWKVVEGLYSFHAQRREWNNQFNVIWKQNWEDFSRYWVNCASNT